MTMEDHLKVVIDAEDSSSHTTSGLVGLHRFIVMPRYLVCSPAFIFMLLTLCLATSTVNMLMHTPVLFQCLSFLLLVCCTRIFSRLIVTALVFFIERYFVMKTNKALYFVFALKTSLMHLCSSSILLSRFFLINPDLSILVIHFVTSTISTFVIANFWFIPWTELAML